MKTLDQYISEQMQNPEFAKAYEKIRPDMEEIREEIESQKEALNEN